ncbi:lasso peptide biosynthesis B2 protein [Dyadobacter sp. 32]|uniref:lasso peptide biosynthesis B2 protein n=1 Tax=Dyadobacter sp. 32 TaxID=538966 RepID=UPI0039C6188F
MGKVLKYWTKWTQLTSSRKLAFVRAVFSLLWIKAGLVFLSFSGFRKLFYWLSRTRQYSEISEKKTDDIVWAVSTAANILPFELLCLPRALATKYLMRNVSSLTLEIGVDINPGTGFEAHAWIERNGKIIIGDWSDSVSYKRIWVWQ